MGRLKKNRSVRTQQQRAAARKNYAVFHGMSLYDVTLAMIIITIIISIID